MTTSLPPASLDPPPYRSRSIRGGDWEITALSDGHMRLDGGSMWGVVPRSMWGAWTPPAADHTILLALRPFLAVRGKDVVVIEVGIGARWEAKWRRIYSILATETLAGSLRACGLAPEDVTHVVASHCHWDHVGAQVVDRGGKLEPLFPNARHFAPGIEVDVAKSPGHARAPSYRADDVRPIEERGMLTRYAGRFDPVPGMRCHVLGGHSDGVSVITLNEDGPGGTAIFWSDVVPTAHHIQPPYVMAYDIDVVKSFEVRSQWLARAAEKGWTGLFYHDVDHPFGRITSSGSRYAFQPT
jgi:glyoxylase-like metal-dependent hydrolase (beta-lactamase superfamily II)